MELGTLITSALTVLVGSVVGAMGWSRHQYVITRQKTEKLRVLGLNYRQFSIIAKHLPDAFLSPTLRAWLAENMTRLLDEMKHIDRKTERSYREDYDALREFSRHPGLSERERASDLQDLSAEEANQARAQLKRCVALGKALHERGQMEADELRTLVHDIRSILTLTAADFYFAKAESAQAKKEYRRALVCWQKYREILRQHHEPDQQIALRLQVADKRIARLRKELKVDRAARQSEGSTLDKQIASFTEADNWKKENLYDDR